MLLKIRVRKSQFRNYKGLSIIFPKSFWCNLTYYESENFSDCSFHYIFGSEYFSFSFSYEKWANSKTVHECNGSLEIFSRLQEMEKYSLLSYGLEQLIIVGIDWQYGHTYFLTAIFWHLDSGFACHVKNSTWRTSTLSCCQLTMNEKTFPWSYGWL